MSVQLYSSQGPGGNDAGERSAAVGGNKPLHRFIRAQPKTIGIIVLISGASLSIVSIALNVFGTVYMWTTIPRGVLVGLLSFISGILFILAEHRPSKKSVAASMVLSIVTVLATVWSLFHLVPDFYRRHYLSMFFVDYNSTESDDFWISDTENMGIAAEVIFTFYTVGAAVVFIVMASVGAAALRSARSQAVVVMTAVPTETPVE